MKRQGLVSAYIELIKPRILMMVLVTTALGFFLGGKGLHSWGALSILLLGVSFVSGGAAALNHYLERDVDKMMLRTRNRPIPQGIISPNHALLYGIVLILSGVLLLWWKINVLTAFLSLLSAFLYVLVYTPMKKVSWLNTTVGAIPGALPPVGGWTAATGQVSLEAWVLFLILFLWQHPHFYSIAWMFREDYKRGGLKMLPVVHPDGRNMFAQIKAFSLALIPVSLLPTYLGMSGTIYFWGALFLGIALLVPGVLLGQSHSIPDARKLLKASVIYLPALLLLIVIDVSL